MTTQDNKKYILNVSSSDAMMTVKYTLPARLRILLQLVAYDVTYTICPMAKVNLINSRWFNQHLTRALKWNSRG